METDYLKEITETIKEKTPSETMITKISMEGPEVAIYTKNPKAFFENEKLVSGIASELKKRVNIRTDKSLLSEEKFAEKKILEIVPEDAQIKSIQFINKTRISDWKRRTDKQTNCFRNRVDSKNSACTDS